MARVDRTRRGSLARQESRDSKSSISLPRGEPEIETDIGRYIHLISGDRKVGKSSLLSCFPDPFIIFCEPGGKSIHAKKQFVKTWEDFKKIVYLLESEPDYCKTVVIDTGYMAYELCFDYMLRIHDLEKPQDENWGNAWKYIEREFRGEQMKLISAGFGIGVTAHTETKTLKKRNGLEYEKLCIQLGGQATKFYSAFADIIVHIRFDDDGNREMIIRGDNTVEAGTRTSEKFLYTDGTRIKSIPFDFTDSKIPEKDAYKRYFAAFNNELINPEKEANRKEFRRKRR